MDGIAGRHAVRHYLAMPIEQSKLEQIIQAASQAPSAMNERPWLFTVVTDHTLLARISNEAKAYAIKTAPVGGPVLEMLNKPGFDIFYGTPALVVISAPKSSRWSVEDCSLAAENLMLAAYALGLGTCWIGFAQSWLNTKQGVESLSLKDDQFVVAPIIVGLPAQTVAVVQQRPVPRIHWIGEDLRQAGSTT